MTAATTEERTAQQKIDEDRAAKEHEARLHDISRFDQVYGPGMLPPLPTGSVLNPQLAWNAYFDLAEQTLRTSRRVTEALFITDLRQQIVQEVRQQVLLEMRPLIDRR